MLANYLIDSKIAHLLFQLHSEAEEDVRTTAVEPEAEAQEDEEGEEVDASFEPIDKLTQYGINASDLKKVKEAGFCTCQSVVMYPKKSLVAIRGMSEAKVDKLIEAAGKILPHLGSSFITSAQVCYIWHKFHAFYNLAATRIST